MDQQKSGNAPLAPVPQKGLGMADKRYSLEFGEESYIMFAIIGMLVVIGAVIGGFLMEHGKIAVLMQPAELVIIGGAALGTLLVGNPLPVVIKIIKCTLGVLKPSPYAKASYLETLKMLNELFQYARKNGLVKLEADVEEPDRKSVV